MSTPSSSSLTSLNIVGKPSYLWVLDFGASHHMSSSSSSFVSISYSPSPEFVMTVDGTSMPLVCASFVCTPHLSLFDIYCVPQLTMNFVYVSQLCNSNYFVHFSFTSCYIQDLQS